MIARAASRPLWGIDPYLHFIVLGLSVVNILFLFLNTFQYSLSWYLELVLSLIGILSFFLTYKKYFIGNILMLLWVLPQLVVIHRVVDYGFTSSFSFNMTQGFSFPFSFTSQWGTDVTSIGVNVIGVFLLLIAIFKLKNRIIGKRLKVSSIDLLEPIELDTSVINVLKRPNGSQFLILNYYSVEGMSYVIQVEPGDKLGFNNGDMVYTLCEIDKSWATQTTIKSSQFKIIGTCKASSL